MILACANDFETKPVCYTYAGLAGDTLDVRIASRLAQTCGLDHHILRISNEFLKDYERHLNRTVFVTDGCAGALGAHEIPLTVRASELSSIRLTGNFGSEILRSASTLKPIGLSSDLVTEDFRKLVDTCVSQVSSEQVHPVTRAAFQEVPWHLFGTLAAARSVVTFRTPYLDNDLVKLAFQAPQNARSSPRSALRLISDYSPALGRIPTDRGVVCGGSRTVKALRSLFCAVTFKLDYLYNEGLPWRLSRFSPLVASLSHLGLLHLHKFLFYGQWFRRELAEYLIDSVASVKSKGLPYWNRNIIDKMVSDHLVGRRNHIREFNAILTLETAAGLLLRPQPALSPLPYLYAGLR
jgi:asparagine synthase (glutamine-hydrolysing)